MVRPQGQVEVLPSTKWKKWSSFQILWIKISTRIRKDVNYVLNLWFRVNLWIYVFGLIYSMRGGSFQKGSEGGWIGSVGLGLRRWAGFKVVEDGEGISQSKRSVMGLVLWDDGARSIPSPGIFSQGIDVISLISPSSVSCIPVRLFSFPQKIPQRIIGCSSVGRSIYSRMYAWWRGDYSVDFF